MIFIAGWRASVSAGIDFATGSVALSPLAPVTLPTIACPPSFTETCACAGRGGRDLDLAAQPATRSSARGPRSTIWCKSPWSMHELHYHR